MPRANSYSAATRPAADDELILDGATNGTRNILADWFCRAVDIAGTPPGSPVTKDLWFDTSVGILKIYNGGQFNNVVTVTSSLITDSTAAGRTLLTAADAAAQRTALSLNNVDNVSAANLRDRSTHTGTQSADTLTDGTTNKAFLATEKTKLAGIATGATANDTDANLRARSSHTGTQDPSTILFAATARFLARVTAGSGAGEEITAAQAKTLLAIASGDVSGLAASATTDTTNAGNIGSGTLPAARLPAPGTTTLGGVKRNAGSGGQYVNGIDTDGSLLYGTPGAGGSTNLWIGAAEFIPRLTTGAGINTIELGTNKINVDVLEFDPSTAWYAQAIRVLPNNWGAGTVTAKFHWTSATSSGNVVWRLAGRAFGDDDALDQAMGTAQTVTDGYLAANDIHVSAATSAITIGGTPASGKAVIFEVSRDATNGSDTLGEKARLIGVEITYTA